MNLKNIFCIHDLDIKNAEMLGDNSAYCRCKKCGKAFVHIYSYDITYKVSEKELQEWFKMRDMLKSLKST